MRGARRALPGLLLAGVAAPVLAAGPVRELRLDAPPPYGYRIGDTIRHEVEVTAEPGYRLNAAALPRPGPLNRWLELRAVEAVEVGRASARQGLEGRAGFGPPRSAEADPTRRGAVAGPAYRLRLEYQMFYAPLTVKTLTIPPLPLRFTGPGGDAGAEVPAWTFSATPLHEPSVYPEGGLAPLRPDAWPDPPDAAPHLLRLAGFGAAALALLGYLGYARGLPLPGGRGRPFGDAARFLRRLEGRESSAAVRREAFGRVHGAFNLTVGEPVFADRLPDFFAAHPGYEPLRPDIEAFFAASYALFFGAEPEPAAESFGLARLETLCRACLRVERSRP
jgi:mxaA protein